jgi:hypothetical protein
MHGDKGMGKISPPEYRFSVERRSDLVKLGVNKTQIAELEAILPMCKLRITNKPPLQDVRDKLKPIQEAFSEICTRIARLKYYAGTNSAAREALNRLQMAAYERRHVLGPTTEAVPLPGLDALAAVLDIAVENLGSQQRLSNTACPEPVWLIAEALSTGWGKEHGDGTIPRYDMPPKKFSEIVQIAYETIGSKPAYVPERALRHYRRWRKQEAERNRAERNKIGTPDPQKI